MILGVYARKQLKWVKIRKTYGQSVYKLTCMKMDHFQTPIEHMGGSRCVCVCGGGGGIQGSGSPFLVHVVGVLTLGPKLDQLLDPPFFAFRPKMAPSF